MKSEAFVAMVARMRKPRDCGDSAESLGELIRRAREISKETAEVEGDEETRL